LNYPYYSEDESASLELWDTTTHSLFKSLSFDAGIQLTSLAFSPDSRFVAVGKADGEISIIDLQTFDVVATLSGHRGLVEHLAFSLDGFYLVSSSTDGTVRFWGVP
jgi:WD40 repeat protein